MKRKVGLCGIFKQLKLVSLVFGLSDLKLELGCLETETQDENFAEIELLLQLSTQQSINKMGFANLGEQEFLIITDLLTRQDGQDDEAYIKEMIPPFRKIMNHAMENGFHGKIILATQFDEIFTYLAWKYTGLPQESVLGLGTMFETNWLTARLAEQLNVGVNDVKAYVLGQSRQKEIIWSRAYLGVTPVLSLLVQKDAEFSAEKMTELGERLFAITEATSRLSRFSLLSPLLSALMGLGSLLTTLTALTEFDEQDLVTTSLPVLINDFGIKKIIDLSVSEEERRGWDEIIGETRLFLNKIEQGQL